MQFLITAIVAVIFLVGVVSSCPSVCSCSDNSFGLDVNCGSRGLDSIPTDLPNNTYLLHLQHNDISVIDGNAFNNLPRLSGLYLYSNKITSIQSGTFTDLPNLHYLRLQYNDISVIEDNAFNNVTSLYRLNLDSNKITSIQSGTFTDLPNLRDLNLESNKITSIQSGTFTDLPNLRFLHLQYNDISVIEDSAFNNLTRLYNLYLYSNKITSIQSGTFTDLPNLHDLYLFSNKITSIQSGTFTDLPNLRYLYLYSNKIISIQSGSFNDLPKLYYLYLYSNQITSIQSGTFTDLPNLHYLSLQNNDISVIEDNTFNNLPNLRSLLMGKNPISLVSENAFAYLTQLTSLEFDMHCGGCTNIPFWSWLKRNQQFSTSVTCSDYDGEKLSNLQASSFTDCFKCMVGYYGYNCNISCDGCLSDSCDSEYGICTNLSGCKPGWQHRQPKCDLACVDGTYGKDCKQICSDNCYNNTCNVVSGLCVSGCRKGWMGPHCQQPCVDGTYWKNCKQICSDNCYNKTCNVVSGLCESGCRKGWMGPHCQQPCSKGHFGNNCTDTCDGCISELCNSSDGVCDITDLCKAGWSGVKCDKVVPKSADKYDAVYSGMGASIASSIQSCIDSHIKPLIETINKQKQTIADHEGTITVQTNKLAEQERTIKEQYAEINDLYNKVSRLEIRIESHEQYSRRTSLRFHNIQVPVDERGRIVHPVDTDKLILQVCNTKLGLDINIHDIGRSHVMGKAKNGKSQIIVRFLSYRIRNRVYANKKALKGDPDGIFITENLTKYKTELVDKLSQLKHSKQIYTYWTFDGRIYVKQTETSRQQTVNSFDDIMNFERSNQQHIPSQSSDIAEP